MGSTLEETAPNPTAPSREIPPEDIELIDALCGEVDELLSGAEDCIRRLHAYVYGLPFDHGDYITFLSGLNVPEYVEAMRGVNRFVHTIKGNAGFMNLLVLKTYCHRVEELTVAIMGGKLYLDRAAYAIIEQIPNVIGRFFEKLREEYRDTAINVDAELAEIERVRGVLAQRVGDEEIPLASFQRQDLGAVRRSGKNLKVSLDLGEMDRILGEYQIAVHTVLGFLQASGADTDKLTEAGRHLNDHLESLLSAAQDRMVLTRYQRIVTDLGKSLGKDIDFSVARNAALARPDVWDHCHNAMVHLVRNAVDHGIEMPAEREAAGKPRRGRIELELWEDHKSAFIELSDDGKGIDPEIVGRLAVQRDLITEAALREMSRQEIQKLIFRAGFSTKEAITDVSGRGVGMDAVTKEIEGNLGGRISLESEVGRGTRVRIEIPKSETLTECVLFGDGNDTYAIPKVRDMTYLDCDPRHMESVLATRKFYTGGEHSFPVLPILPFLERINGARANLRGHTIIRLAGNTGEFGIAVPLVHGHKRLKVERKKLWSSVFGQSDIVYGYGISDPVVVVLDLEKIESLAFSEL